jgi:hypothetical protein
MAYKMEKINPSISDELADTVAEAGLIGLSSEILEFSIDQVLEEGLIKDIPVVGWISKGLSLQRSISDRILFNKILRFIIALESFDSGSKDSFRTKIKNNAKYKRKVGEHLLLILDRIEDLSKPEMVAKCFDHHLTGDLDFSHFLDLVHVIERSTVGDLQALSCPDNKRILFGSVGQAVGCGILEYGICKSEDDEQPEIGTRLSRLGKDLRDVLKNRFRGREERVKKSREEIIRRFKLNIEHEANKER